MAKVYISGKITGIEDKAPAMFKRAEDRLQKAGHETVNPMTLNHDHDKSWEAYMREDVKAMCDCDTIYMLENWATSKGAKIEKEIAQKIGIKVIYEPALGAF